MAAREAFCGRVADRRWCSIEGAVLGRASANVPGGREINVGEERSLECSQSQDSGNRYPGDDLAQGDSTSVLKGMRPSG